MITNQPHSSIFNIVILLLWLMTGSECGHHPQSHQHSHNHYHEHRHHHHQLQSGVDDRGNFTAAHRHKRPLFNEKTDRERIQEAVRALRQPVHRLHIKSSTPRASIISPTEATHHHRLRHHYDHHRWRQETTRSPTSSHARHQVPWWGVDSPSSDARKHQRWPQHSKGYSSHSRNHDRSHSRHHDRMDREEIHYHTTSIRPVRASPRGSPGEAITTGRHRAASLLLKSNERSSRMGHGVSDKRTYDDDEYHDDEEQVDSLRNSTTFYTSQRRRSYNVDDITAPGYRPGDLTNHKFRTLGTQEGVQHSRNEYMVDLRRIQAQERQKAMEHTSRILYEAECKWPRPKVIPVPNNDTAKAYAPHCTILHRCGDDTGCCGTEGLVCTARNTTTVDLYFHVTKLGRPSRTERLTFVNHTRCHCVSRQEYFRSLDQPVLAPAPIQTCQCPRFFDKTILDDSSCRCDCQPQNDDCKSLKEGEEGFSLEDRRCIQEGRCKLPICEFGNYVRRTGRCPRREDKIQWGSSTSL